MSKPYRRRYAMLGVLRLQYLTMCDDLVDRFQIASADGRSDIAHVTFVARFAKVGITEFLLQLTVVAEPAQSLRLLMQPLILANQHAAVARCQRFDSLKRYAGEIGLTPKIRANCLRGILYQQKSFLPAQRQQLLQSAII